MNEQKRQKKRERNRIRRKAKAEEKRFSERCKSLKERRTLEKLRRLTSSPVSREMNEQFLKAMPSLEDQPLLERMMDKIFRHRKSRKAEKKEEKEEEKKTEIEKGGSNERGTESGDIREEVPA